MAKRTASADGARSKRTAEAARAAPRRRAASSVKRSSAVAPSPPAKPRLRRARRAVPPPPPVVAPPFGPPPQATLAPGAAASRLAQAPAASSAAAAREPEAAPSGFLDRGLPVPDDYGFDRLVALVRDPQCLFSYWELHGPRLPEVRAERGQSFIDACAWVLRVHRINENAAVDLEVEPVVGNWYVHVGAPGRYQLELGILAPDGEWVSLLASEIVETPREGPSDELDEEWRLRPEDEEALLRAALDLTEARKRGTSAFLGASRLQSSFAFVTSGMFGGSASGRPVAGSWGGSFAGASGRVAGSGSGSGGFGWLLAPTGAREPVLERPMPQGGGPNWNAQPELPASRPGKTQQAHFTVKLPRVLQGLPLPRPTWPPRQRTGRAVRRKAAQAKSGSLA